MSTIQLETIPGVEDLDARGLMTAAGGLPIAPVLWGVGIYLAKTVGDHWGAFKDGVADGFTATWGEH